MNAVEQYLAGSPYVIPESAKARERFARTRESSVQTRSLAVTTNERIRTAARDLLVPYTVATRSDLVTESNRIEGYLWEPASVRQVVKNNLPLLDGSEHALTEVVRADPKLYEVLGLYRAHELADAWKDSQETPKAAHIRELHRMILGNIYGSGSYKVHANEISGRKDLKTADPMDVPRLMNDLADWWGNASSDPLLTATVVHAWLAHIHPFSDGNGRLARVLANLELSRNSYAPLILSATGDRGEYYDALKESDNGDILPLYELFEKVIKRQSKTMARSSYIEEIIDDRLLVDETYRYNLWSALLSEFSDHLQKALRERGWRMKREGELGLKSFALLGRSDSDGNSWFATVGPRRGDREWLLWFGYRSEEWRGLAPADADPYPSIFVSRRDPSPEYIHPFRWEARSGAINFRGSDELRLIPLKKSSTHIRQGAKILHLGVDSAAELLADDLAH